MIPNYRTVTISAGANENIIPLIYEQLKENGYNTPTFTLDFIGFEAAEGTSFKINGNPLKVPSTEKFITPYGGDGNKIIIRSVTFDSSISNMNFWIIF